MLRFMPLNASVQIVLPLVALCPAFAVGFCVYRYLRSEERNPNSWRYRGTPPHLRDAHNPPPGPRHSNRSTTASSPAATTTSTASLAAMPTTLEMSSRSTESQPKPAPAADALPAYNEIYSSGHKSGEM